MAKKIDETLARILKDYGEDASAVWDCHGTWVAYHAAIERIAAKADIVFDPPAIIEANGAAGTVAICVTGRIGDNEDFKTAWSFGEANPKNNKNAYPYAMAEKRAKDRVVLKLIGLHGMVYSEEEADDFRPDDAPPAEPAKPSVDLVAYMHEAKEVIANHTDAEALKTWWADETKKMSDTWMPPEKFTELKAIALAKVKELTPERKAA